MKPVRVLLATPLSTVGGTELSTLSIARYLNKAGHQVTVVASPHVLAEEFSREGIEVFLGAMDRRGPLGLIGGVRDIRRSATARSAHIIDAQMAYTAVQAALAARTIRRPRVSVIWHCRGVKPRTYGLMARLGNGLIDFVITNCDSERKRLEERGLSADRVRTIYNFPNVAWPDDAEVKDSSLLDEWGIDEHATIVASISRLVPHRGNQHYLEAVAVLRSQDSLPPARFLIVGDGTQQPALRRMASDLGIDDLVIFTGARRDMERVYATLDIVVNPTLWGMGTGNINAEGMAWGKPVIATNVGGIPELVDHGRTGLVVPPGDSSELAAAIRCLLEQPDAARRMGNAGRAKVRAVLSPQHLVSEIEEVYELVLSRNG